MNAGKMALSALAGIYALAATRGTEVLTDDEVKERIVKFVRLPSLLCGHAAVDFRNELRTRKLTNRPWFDGDTNRLARLICELAQTNNAEIAEMMVDELGEYGTPAQLPFLYSCATNPVVGNRAVMAIFNIESVTSNSVDSLQRYLTLLPTSTETMYDKSVICRDTLRFMAASAAPSDMQAALFRVVRGFVANVSLANSMIDPALMAADGTYRYSRRRLADLWAAYPRCFNEYQTNYVTNAINELVAYPEANLPE